jgi:hypothetical protein
MLARVDPLAEASAFELELGEVPIGRAQVVIGGHEIGLGDPDRRLRAALRLRVRRHARRDRQPVVARGGHDPGIAHRDPTHLIDRHRALVVGQRVGRRAAEQAQRPVQRHHHRRKRLVPQRQHDAKARPGKPGAEQQRPPPAHHGAIAIVPLHPQTRLGHPRPCPAAVLAPEAPLGLGDRAPGGALRSQIAHRDQLLVRPVGTDPPARTLNQLLHLVRERAAHRPRPDRHRQATPRLLAGAHPVRHSLVVAADQLRRRAQRARQIECLQDLHHFLRTLQARLLDAPR